MIILYRNGNRDYKTSPFPLSKRDSWEILLINQGRIGMLLQDRPQPVYNDGPVVWVSPAGSYHGKISNENHCHIYIIFTDKVPLLLEKFISNHGSYMFPMSDKDVEDFKLFYHQGKTTNDQNDALLSIKEDLMLQKLSLMLLEKVPKSQLPRITKTRHQSVSEGLHWYEENLDKSPSIENIASYLGYSISHFRKIVNEEYGKSPIELTNEIQMERAQYFLRATNMSIEDVSRNCGYKSSSAFSRFFKMKLGVSPKTWKGGA